MCQTKGLPYPQRKNTTHKKMQFSFKKLSDFIRVWRDRFARSVIGGRMVDPDHVTLFSLLLSLPAAYFFIERNVFAGTSLLLLVAGLDLFDGYAARNFPGKGLALGQTLDYSTDRLSEAVVKIGLILGGFASILPAMLSLFTNTLVTFFVTEGERHRIQLDYITPFPTRLAVVGAFMLNPFFSWSTAENVFILELVITSLMSFYAIRKILKTRDH